MFRRGEKTFSWWACQKLAVLDDVGSNLAKSKSRWKNAASERALANAKKCKNLLQARLRCTRIGLASIGAALWATDCQTWIDSLFRRSGYCAAEKKAGAGARRAASEGCKGVIPCIAL